jgi:hypothetical protein
VKPRKALTRASAASSAQVPVRCTLEERERWRAAADAAGVSLSDVAREAWERLARRERRRTALDEGGR